MSGLNVYVGTLVDSRSKQIPLQIRTCQAIGVKNGKIVFIQPVENLDELKTNFAIKDDKIQFLPSRTFLMPGMIDTHIHPAQFPNSGIGLDLQLRDWLHQFTFPIEIKCDNEPQFARQCYRAAVSTSIRNGTTTANYFPTIDLGSARILYDTVDKLGQRAFMGPSCKNSKLPENYTQTISEAVQTTKAFIEETRQKMNPRIQATVLPRSQFSCDDEMLMELSKIGKENNVLIHTHMSEIKKKSTDDFGKYKNCTELFSACGVLTSKTILAHCVYIEDDEINTLSTIGVSVSHCPNSNISLQSGLCNVRRLMNAGVKVGLGTDISGGYSVSILDAMRSAVQTSKVLKIINQLSPLEEMLSFKDVFYLATLGGAEALSIDEKVGNFEVGKSFDALLIDLNTQLSGCQIFAEDSDEEVIQKFIMLGDDRNISSVYVDGKCIY